MRAVNSLPIPDLPAALTALLRQIPPGRVTTYGDLAEALGDLKAAKWVAAFLLDHPHEDGCPCFRVVRRTGEVGLFVERESNRKSVRLVADGVTVTEGHVDLPRYRFSDFTSDRPLRALAELQNEIPTRVEFEPLPRVPDVVASVDVSYSRGSAFAAYALVEPASGELVDAHVIDRPASFPYISGYLSFRELPVLMALVESLPSRLPLADILFVDGNGVLHPRGAGIATHFGVLSGLRTIGVGKKLLCGQVDLDGLEPGKASIVTHSGRAIGAAVKASERSRPIYISTGHRMILEDAVRLTQRLFHGHRLPEPLFHADRLSREAGTRNSSSS